MYGICCCMLTFCWRERSQMILRSQKFEYELNISHQLHINFIALLISPKNLSKAQKVPYSGKKKSYTDYQNVLHTKTKNGSSKVRFFGDSKMVNLWQTPFLEPLLLGVISQRKLILKLHEPNISIKSPEQCNTDL